MSVDLTDFVYRGRKNGNKVDKVYRLFCDKCNADRGYNAKRLAAGLCASCASRNKMNSVPAEVRTARARHAVSFVKNHSISEERKRKISLANKGKRCNLAQRISNSARKQGISVDDWSGFVYESEDPKRSKFKFSRINLQVFQRDNFACQLCHKRGGKLNAHHLDNWKQFKELRYELSNLVTLCVPCHKAFHNKYGTRNNVRSQFEEFKENVKQMAQ